MEFTGFRVYLPNGGQSQRIGLSLDVYMLRTTEGIRDGRAELMMRDADFFDRFREASGSLIYVSFQIGKLDYILTKERL